MQFGDTADIVGGRQCPVGVGVVVEVVLFVPISVQLPSDLRELADHPAERRLFARGVGDDDGGVFLIGSGPVEEMRLEVPKEAVGFDRLPRKRGIATHHGKDHVEEHATILDRPPRAVLIVATEPGEGTPGVAPV